MNPFRYFLGRAMQIVGLGALTYVVLMFFTQLGMEPLRRQLLLWRHPDTGKRPDLISLPLQPG